MKKLLILTLLATIYMTASCQTDTLQGEQRAMVINSIEKNAASAKTLRKDFVQTRTSSLLTEPVVMKGRFFYDEPCNVIWEYTEPQQRTIKITDKDMTMIVDGKETALNPRVKKMVQNFTMMLTGNKTKLLDETLFDITMFDNGNAYIAQLMPIRKDMQRMFAKITFVFSHKTYQVVSLILTEQEGNDVKIEFNDIK